MTHPSSQAKLPPLLTLLAVGNFAVGVGAFIVIGILSSIAAGIGVSKADAGIILTAYAAAYALLSPVGAALTGSLPRRTVLAAALGLFCLGTFLSAVSTSLPMLTASRILVAFGAALYTPLSAGVAVAIAPPEFRGRALAKVFSGMTMAQIFGVPLGAWLASQLDWHGPFYVVAAGAALCAVVLMRAMPADISFPAGNIRSILSSLVDGRLMLAVSLTTVAMSGIYLVFTFFSPLIEASVGANPEMRSAYLMLFGFGAVAGNYAGGVISDRIGPFRTLIMVLCGQIVMLPLFAIIPMNPYLLGLLVFVWSSFAWSYVPPQQSRLVSIAPHAPSLALAINAAMSYLGIALGSAAGSVLFDWQGLSILGIGGGLLAFAAMVHLIVSNRVIQKVTA